MTALIVAGLWLAVAIVVAPILGARLRRARIEQSVPACGCSNARVETEMDWFGEHQCRPTA